MLVATDEDDGGDDKYAIRHLRQHPRIKPIQTRVHSTRRTSRIRMCVSAVPT
jgi:hypothetical protein